MENERSVSIMNRTMKIVVSIVLCVWIFAMGIELGAFRERRAINASLSSGGNTQQTTLSNQTNQTTQPTTTQPTTTQPTTDKAPVADPTDNPVNPSEAPSQAPSEAPAAKLPSTPEEVVKAYNDALNATKNTTKAFTATQVENVSLKLVDSSIPSMLQGVVSSLMESFMGEETNTYSNADMTAFKDNLPPPGKEATLTVAGVKTATAEPYGDGGYKLNITLAPETATYEAPPVHHSASVGYLDIDSLGLPFTVSSCDFTYDGAQVTLCVNKDGLVDSYAVDFPLAANGSGKAMGMTASVVIEGKLDEKWDITWQ